MHPRGEEGPPDTFGTFGEPVEAELARQNVDVRGGESASTEHRRREAWLRFWVVAGAVIPFVATAWWMRRHRS
jgi:hypothetical protein